MERPGYARYAKQIRARGSLSTPERQKPEESILSVGRAGRSWIGMLRSIRRIKGRPDCAMFSDFKEVIKDAIESGEGIEWF